MALSVILPIHYIPENGKLPIEIIKVYFIKTIKTKTEECFEMMSELRYTWAKKGMELTARGNSSAIRKYIKISKLTISQSMLSFKNC